MKFNFNKRVALLKSKLREHKLDAAIISNLKNIYYLSGFKGSNALLLVSADETFKDKFFSDPRYDFQAEQEVANCFEINIMNKGLYTSVVEIIKQTQNMKTIGLETCHIIYDMHQFLQKELPHHSLMTLGNIVKSLRLRKDELEVKFIKKAISISQKALMQTLPFIVPGVRELDIANKLEFSMKELGADHLAFDIIVAAAACSSMPHARATKSRLKTGDCVKIDFGCSVCGYNSDLTRTFFLDKISRKFKEVYKNLKEVQSYALHYIKPGLPAKELDAKIREMMAKDGLEKYFTHSLGHGVGLDVHEDPVIFSKSEFILEENMVFTIEPGVYFKENFGFRIEDMVLVTKNGCEVLSSLPKEEEEIIIGTAS